MSATSVTRVSRDAEKLTMTMTSDYDVTAERAWQLWADPRQLEQWWGPPTYPATVQQHDLRPDGTVSYSMTGPGGDTSRGRWRVVQVEPPRLLVFDNGFADEAGEPDAAMPTMLMRVEITDRPGGVTMSIQTQFGSLADLDMLIAMGLEEGLQLAMGQIDAILAGASGP